jgi:prephenate dehydrogenase
MWAELFLENKDNTLSELDTLIASLNEYRQAIAGNDLSRLTALLEDGKRRKEEVDG